MATIFSALESYTVIDQPIEELIKELRVARRQLTAYHALNFCGCEQIEFIVIQDAPLPTISIVHYIWRLFS